MSSWRDETSQETQDELDELLDVSLRTAKEKLDAAGEFYPFAVALDEPGATHQLTPEVKVGPRQVADVSQVFELCWVALRSEAADLRAAAVVTNVGGPTATRSRSPSSTPTARRSRSSCRTPPRAR